MADIKEKPLTPTKESKIDVNQPFVSKVYTVENEPEIEKMVKKSSDSEKSLDTSPIE